MARASTSNGLCPLPIVSLLALSLAPLVAPLISLSELSVFSLPLSDHIFWAQGMWSDRGFSVLLVRVPSLRYRSLLLFLIRASLLALFNHVTAKTLTWN